MTTTTDPRIAVLSSMATPHVEPDMVGMPWDDAVKLLDDYRAAVLREAADAVAALVADGEHDPDCLVDELRSLASRPQSEVSDG